MIFRAVYYRRDPYLAANSEPEAFVFVEAYTETEAGQKLAVILPALLGCSADEVEWYNLESEAELTERAVAGEHPDGLHLVESGFASGAPLYPTHEQPPPLLLLGATGRMRVRKAMVLANAIMAGP